MNSIVAELFVDVRGPYFGCPDIDPWDENRDARQYVGPWPVVAHPPCARWGRYWFGGPSAKVRRQLGDDNGCFAAALEAVRKFGGVLEHPEASHAFRYFQLGKPSHKGKWQRSDDNVGWICQVEQGNYGHLARKKTWLYAVGTELPELKWGPSQARMRLDDGFHSREERLALRTTRIPIKCISSRERLLTPRPFADVLLCLARSVELRTEKQVLTHELKTQKNKLLP